MILYTNRLRTQWLTLSTLVLFTLLLSQVAAASEPEPPHLFARQQQNPGTPSPNPPQQQPPSSSASSSTSTSQPAASSATATTPSSRPTSLPPLGSPGSGTIIGGPGIPVGPNSIIDPRRPVSRLSMVQPKQNSINPPLFPVGSNIVFEWVFDNTTLVFPPANLTVEVALTSNPKMVWPVANISGTATSTSWSTGAVASPLFMGFYTLSIYDTKLGKQGVATSGHLMPYSDLQFGMYIPEPYVPRTGAYCNNCKNGINGATSTLPHRTSQVLQLVILGVSTFIAIWGLTP
ncbi:MAG: hypothetical protein JOS17DRAFT_803439 [Linnemannia elongata]|nr:MAG: hypothetical protein JOS17DRAFT_803439 [Linnemannia elongata]